ncbi:unnamed protein product [Heligmosomoides polygyrus]|uniref:Uncharacterized protein n=1 Tax=Heligmosomoides polygyrus TaxID=6339 RepID=A0A183FZ82_HELPZ|nr:unnamed protein product [Heligmosomoides polygyrus]
MSLIRTPVTIVSRNGNQGVDGLCNGRWWRYIGDPTALAEPIGQAAHGGRTVLCGTAECGGTPGIADGADSSCALTSALLIDRLLAPINPLIACSCELHCCSVRKCSDVC